MRTHDHDVIIVGAGPTGLMLAAELALAGVDAAIVERKPVQARVGGRAGGLHARTLEILDQRGIVDRFLAEGKTHSRVSFHAALDISDVPTATTTCSRCRRKRPNGCSRHGPPN